MNTIRVIENKTNKVLEEIVVDTMSMMMVKGETLRHKWNNKVEGGCTIEEYYTTPDRITKDKKPVGRYKTWDCM